MIARGDVCWVDLGPIVDRGPAKHRPVVIVHSDDYTRSRLGTVVVAAISSSTARAGIPGNVFVPTSASGLPISPQHKRPNIEGPPSWNIIIIARG